jgi:hypothetical protein
VVTTLFSFALLGVYTILISLSVHQQPEVNLCSTKLR